MDIIHAEIIQQENQFTFKDKRVLIDFEKAEFMLGKNPKFEDNDFEIQFNLGAWIESEINLGNWIYIPNTEWGGRVEKIDHVGNTVKISGPNMRYFIGQDILYPYYNHVTQKLNAYFTVSEEANKALELIRKSIRYRTAAHMYEISTVDTGVKVNDQFRFTYLLDGVSKMLDKFNMRLVVKHKSYGVPLLVYAEHIKDYSENFDSDYNVDINSTISVDKDITFMTGLGKGELENRQVLLMIRDEKGVITEFAPFVTAMERDTGVSKQYIYDQPNAESIDELRKGMLAKFEELKREETITIDFASEDNIYNLGDIVGGTDEVTGLSIKQQINQKILTISSSGAQVTYKVGG